MQLEKILKNKIASFLLLFLCAGYFVPLSIFSQETQGSKEGTRVAIIEEVLIGPHPDYSRLLIKTNKFVKYTVDADFLKKQIVLVINNAKLGPKARPRIFKDLNLQMVELLEPSPGTVQIALHLQNQNSRFFHFQKSVPQQIVVDVLGKGKPFIKARIKEPSKETTDAETLKLASKRTSKDDKGKEKEKSIENGKAPRRGLKIPGFTQADVQEALVRDREDRVRNGRDDFKEALLRFQQKRYPEALRLFKQFREKYPGSRHLADIAYLTAQAEYALTFRQEIPIFERTIEALNFALREYPESKFADQALAQLASVYDEMNLTLEARALYEEGLRKDPKGLFSNYFNTQLALLQLRENQYEKAYIALNSILKRSPRDENARDGIFRIAKWYFDQEEYDKALEIYEDGEKRWPRYLNEKAEVKYFMGEIYFKNEAFNKARRHYFDYINLLPDTSLSFKALNRIGDSFFIEGNDRAGLAIFDESAKRKTGGREAQYGKIRLADIGIRNPNLKINNIVFDLDPYFNPFKTYDQIFESAADANIEAEVLLSRGIAYLRSQRYLDAVAQFKSLLAAKPQRNYVRAAEKYLKQSLIFLVEKLSKQRGYLPILYAYSDYLGLSLGDINNVKTVLLIGEAYQKIGMEQEAIKHYERVKRLDTHKTYSDRIFLNLGRIHLSEKQFKEAERVARAFVNKFPRSDLMPQALLLQAEALAGKKEFDPAIGVYREILEKGLGERSDIHYRIAKIQMSMDKPKDAIESFNQSIQTFDRSIKPPPEHVPNAYYNYGVALYNNENYEEAVKALDRARQLYPNHPLNDWAEFLIADSFSKLKESGKSIERMNKIIKVEKYDPLLKRAAQNKLDIIKWEKDSKDLG
jgi:tetratricopeptide (TPR) repeat protein